MISSSQFGSISTILARIPDIVVDHLDIVIVKVGEESVEIGACSISSVCIWYHICYCWPSVVPTYYRKGVHASRTRTACSRTNSTRACSCILGNFALTSHITLISAWMPRNPGILPEDAERWTGAGRGEQRFISNWVEIGNLVLSIGCSDIEIRDTT